VSQMWYDVLKKNPGKKCMLFEERSVTFAQVETQSSQMSNWLLGKGVKKGDCVALLMENRPEFVIAWLGMTKIGVRVALINTAIKNAGLLHCVKISECKMLFFGAELAESVHAIEGELRGAGIQLFSAGAELTHFCTNAEGELAAASHAAPSPTHREGIAMGDTFGYIYTSGTTGLPKAAVILHQKMYTFGAGMGRAFQVRESDVIYTCLPLFHSAGGGLGIGIMLWSGCTVVIKKKFSASEWWKDAVKYNVTVAQYIGELCRYLILQKPTPEEKQHKVRICIGNGLRSEIWGEFQERFNVPEIGEFYGSTEGNAALFNHCRTKDARGACGRMGALLKRLTGVELVKFDVVEEEPVRGADRFCQRCGPDEAGELLFPIRDNDPATRFAGYSDKKATEKKVITDVFVKGDKYFRTGDLLKHDAKGYYHFVDRIGDTFRWKGENCSTTEVEEVLANFPGVEEINVYGVQIPNNMDGRAPTAAITPIDGDMSKIDFAKLAEHAKKNLPSYAVPLFLRMQPQMAVTATLKLQKVELRSTGIEHDKIGQHDKLFWMHPQKKSYVEFTPADLKEISQHKAKL
jgi:fatty-acyl-CoA synthase